MRLSDTASMLARNAVALILNDVGFFKRTIMDLPEKPIRVFEHRTIKQYCADCAQLVWKDVALPHGIYGPRLQSLAAMLKNLTISHEKIADLFRELGAPSFSSATVQEIAGRFAGRLKGHYESFLEQLRKAPFAHLDETGFRRDGQNGYIWGAFTKRIAILKAEISRARLHITTLMQGFRGVVVTDGYNAYDEFPVRQRCWSHLMRDFKDCAEDNVEIEVQYQRAEQLYERLKEMNTGPPDENAIAQARWELQDIVTCLKTIKGATKLATLIENGGDDWFTALYSEGVPLTNNLAERELRPIVLLRKTIGCYRNEKGKNWIDIAVSVIQTWKLQGINVFQQLTAVASTA